MGLLATTTPTFVAGLFGCWILGAVPVPLAIPMRFSPEALVQGIRSRLRRAGAELVGMDEPFASLPGLESVGARISTLDLAKETQREIQPREVDAQSPALIQFTSGSTSQPKGVTLSHDALFGNERALRERCRFGAGDICVGWMPLYHDAGLMGQLLWPTLLEHLDVYLISPEVFAQYPRRWLEAASRYRGSITIGPNFSYYLAARLLRSSQSPFDLAPLRLAFNGGEPVDQAAVGFVEAASESCNFSKQAMLPVYGLAEATLIVSAPQPPEPLGIWWVDRDRLAIDGIGEETNPGPHARSLVSVGYPLDQVHVEIRDPSGKPMPAGHVGEIAVRTAYGMSGYWNDPATTADVMQDGWILTGDLGAFGEKGLVITGRIKDMIIAMGRNIYPEDAETVAENIPGVRRGNAIAFGVVRGGRESLVLIGETYLDGTDAQSLARRIAREVSSALSVGVDNVLLVKPRTLPKTSSGKKQRSLCKSRYELGTYASSVVGNQEG